MTIFKQHRGGQVIKNGKVRLQMEVETELRDDIVQFARDKRVSVTEAMRMLCEWGLAKWEEPSRHRPVASMPVDLNRHT